MAGLGAFTASEHYEHEGVGWEWGLNVLSTQVAMQMNVSFTECGVGAENQGCFPFRCWGSGLGPCFRVTVAAEGWINGGRTPSSLDEVG